MNSQMFRDVTESNELPRKFIAESQTTHFIFLFVFYIYFHIIIELMNIIFVDYKMCNDVIQI